MIYFLLFYLMIILISPLSLADPYDEMESIQCGLNGNEIFQCDHMKLEESNLDFETTLDKNYGHFEYTYEYKELLAGLRRTPICVQSFLIGCEKKDNSDVLYVINDKPFYIHNIVSNSAPIVHVFLEISVPQGSYIADLAALGYREKNKNRSESEEPSTPLNIMVERNPEIDGYDKVYVIKTPSTSSNEIVGIFVDDTENRMISTLSLSQGAALSGVSNYLATTTHPDGSAASGKKKIKDRPHKCRMCESAFSQFSNLKSHIRTHTGERPFMCSVCNKDFIRSNHLTRHMHGHTGKRLYKCSVCNKGFTQSNTLKAHMRTHTGERPFMCSVCNKDFTRSNHLTRHMHGHTGKRLYKCSVCNKGFTQSNTLKAHMRTHTGEKPYRCSICNKSWTQSGNLAVHMRVHTGEKPYKCTICNKGFAQPNTLKDHMRTHTGEKPYRCSICNKSCTQSGNLAVHMRGHTGEKPYKCTICNKSFAQSDTLKDHVHSHTKKKSSK